MPRSPTARDAAEGLAEEHLCPTGETFTVNEVRACLRDELGDEPGSLARWGRRQRVSSREAAMFLFGMDRIPADLARAIGFEPVTVYRPITEAGRQALRPRTAGGGEA